MTAISHATRPPQLEDQPESFNPLVGRDYEVNFLLETLQKDLSVLVTGQEGIGKVSVLRRVYEKLSETDICIWVPRRSTKEQLVECIRQLHEKVGFPEGHGLIPERLRHKASTHAERWEWMERSVNRLRISDCIKLIETVIASADQPIVLFVESLDVTPTQAEHLVRVFGPATVAAAMITTNCRIRVKKLLWKFQLNNRLELKPLSADATKTIVRQWLINNPLTFEGYVTPKKFEKMVVRESRGIPAAIMGILQVAAAEKVITEENFYELNHQASERGIDLTPFLIILIAAAVASKFIGRGISSTELYLVAGIGIGLGIIVRYILFPLLADPKKK